MNNKSADKPERQRSCSAFFVFHNANVFHDAVHLIPRFYRKPFAFITRLYLIRFKVNTNKLIDDYNIKEDANALKTFNVRGSINNFVN